MQGGACVVVVQAGGIMPTLGGLTVWAWQVLTVPGSSERNTLGWGMVWCSMYNTFFQV